MRRALCLGLHGVPTPEYSPGGLQQIDPALLQSKPDPQINESQPETRQRAHPCSREFRCCLCGYEEARRHSPMPLISCRLFRRLLSSAMAFSICCRDPSSSPFSSSAGPTALHKPGKDAISELGSWQSELTASDGPGSRLSDENKPPALLLIYPGTTVSSRRKGAAGGQDRRALLKCPKKAQTGRTAEGDSGPPVVQISWKHPSHFL